VIRGKKKSGVKKLSPTRLQGFKKPIGKNIFKKFGMFLGFGGTMNVRDCWASGGEILQRI